VLCAASSAKHLCGSRAGPLLDVEWSKIRIGDRVAELTGTLSSVVQSGLQRAGEPPAAANGYPMQPCHRHEINDAR